MMTPIIQFERSYTGEEIKTGDGRVVFLEYYKGSNPYAEQLLKNIKNCHDSSYIDMFIKSYESELDRTKMNESFYRHKMKKLDRLKDEYNGRMFEIKELFNNENVPSLLLYLKEKDENEKWYATHYNSICKDYEEKVKNNNSKHFDYVEELFDEESESEFEEEDYDY